MTFAILILRPRSSSRILAMLALLLSVSVVTHTHANVKLSSSDICHDPSSPYYESVKNFTPFETLELCLQAGGRLPKTKRSVSQSTESNAVAEQRSGQSSYSRDKFGRGWSDTDNDCQSSRHETLIAQSTAPVRFKTGRECRITAGRWISLFTGDVIHDPSKIDIDHVVPLKWAWEHGADSWSNTKRDKFANDPANLLSVEAVLNRQKGFKGPDEWLPPANHCQYMVRFLRVMRAYRLKLSQAEQGLYATIQQKVCK